MKALAAMASEMSYYRTQNTVSTLMDESTQKNKKVEGTSSLTKEEVRQSATVDDRITNRETRQDSIGGLGNERSKCQCLGETT